MLSSATKALWAKKAKQNRLEWLPLLIHMMDSGNIAVYLWREWLSDQSKSAIAASIFKGRIQHSTEDEIDRAISEFIRFLAQAHDIGKATPVFQIKPSYSGDSGLDETIFNRLTEQNLFDPSMTQWDFSQDARHVPHGRATQALLTEAGCSKAVAAILGAHHGQPSSNEQYTTTRPEIYPHNFWTDDAQYQREWKTVQEELIRFALDSSGYNSIEEIPTPNLQGQVLLTGLVIMADWLASNEQFFPLIHVENEKWERLLEPEFSDERALKAWDAFNVTEPWKPYEEDWQDPGIFTQRFAKDEHVFEPWPMQTLVWEILQKIDDPGIMVIEAPMGEGKTEAALVAAEAFAQKHGSSGVYFALPTQATSDGLFPRITDWIKRLEDDSRHNIILAHGKAQFNDDYRGLFEGSAYVDEYDRIGKTTLTVHSWFQGNKKSLLADFVVGTVDQLLMMALKHKHVMLRHLGLAGKIIIIDECHAYDAYMSQYLKRALNWLGAYHVPVILLSATLPSLTRQELVRAYLNIDEYDLDQKEGPWETAREYPLITYTSNGDVYSEVSRPRDWITRIKIRYVQDDDLVDQLRSKVSDGGCVGIIVNTVRRAQVFSRLLEDVFGNDIVRTIHSQFIATDRIAKEKQLLEELGPSKAATGERPELRIVVGTQVLEQSLNIDFDLLITDLSPMDLLLQRMGREHRFQHTHRPEQLQSPECWILQPNEDVSELEPGSEYIYGRYLLQRTQGFLPDEIVLPIDIPNLVQNTYDDAIGLAKIPEDNVLAYQKHQYKASKQAGKAGAYRIGKPNHSPRASLISWLDAPLSDVQGEAAVRDIDPTIEVVVLFKGDEDNLYYFHDKHNNRHLIHNHQAPRNSVAQALAQHRINLPRSFSYGDRLEKTIKDLEAINNAHFKTLLESVWLAGELILPLDSNSQLSFAGHRLIYSNKEGLLFEIEGGDDEQEG